MLKKVTYLILSLLVMMQSVCSAGIVVGASEVSPVVAGFVGSTNTPDSYTNISGADNGGYGSFVCTTSGQVTKIKFYASSLDANTNAGIYSSDGSTLLMSGVYAPKTATTSVVEVSLQSPLNITSGTTYTLAACSDSSFWTIGRKNVVDSNWKFSASIDCSTNMPNSISGGTTNNNYEMIIWAE